MLEGFPYRWTKAGWVFLLLAAYATGAYVTNVLVSTHWLGPRETTAIIFATLPRVDNAILFVHVACALPALLIGIWEFLPSLRKGYALKLHRWFGKVYVFGILASSTTGFVLAINNSHGWVARGGFGTLATVWFTTTWMAYRTVRGRDLIGHRRWMIRSYAITLAVVTVRFLATPKFGFEHAQWYPIMTWLCWLPNAALAELYVRTTDYMGRISARRSHSRRAARNEPAAALASFAD